MKIYLYKNKKKSEPKHPDYRAVIQKDGTFKPAVIAYVNQSQTGNEYIKVVIDEGGEENEHSQERPQSKPRDRHP